MGPSLFFPILICVFLKFRAPSLRHLMFINKTTSNENMHRWFWKRINKLLFWYFSVTNLLRSSEIKIEVFKLSVSVTDRVSGMVLKLSVSSILVRILYWQKTCWKYCQLWYTSRWIESFAWKYEQVAYNYTSLLVKKPVCFACQHVKYTSPCSFSHASPVWYQNQISKKDLAIYLEARSDGCHLSSHHKRAGVSSSRFIFS